MWQDGRPYMCVSQTWLDIRIIWGNFKKSWCPGTNPANYTRTEHTFMTKQKQNQKQNHLIPTDSFLKGFLSRDNFLNQEDIIWSKPLITIMLTGS